MQFTAIGTFTDNSTENLTGQVSWASTATSVATVSNAPGRRAWPRVSAQGPTTISATLDGITGSTVLTVRSAVLESLAITPANPLMRSEAREQFSGHRHISDNSTQNLTSAVNWASGTTSVASISNVLRLARTGHGCGKGKLHDQRRRGRDHGHGRARGHSRAEIDRYHAGRSDRSQGGNASSSRPPACSPTARRKPHE